MANTLGAYSPIFYAQEILIHLRKALGMAARVHRGYEQERNSFDLGDTITIRKPATFTAQNAPSSSQDLNTQSVSILLDQWKEVKVELSDKERVYTGERIIAEHIQPMSYAIADNVDMALAALYKDIPWVSDYGSATDHTIITMARKMLFDNQVPLTDGMTHFMVDSTLEAGFLNATTGLVGTAPGATEAALMRGTLGTRFGVEVFANQNTPTHTPGTATMAAGDKALAINQAAGLLKGATTVIMSGATGVETLLKGDTFVIAGNSQRYAVTVGGLGAGGAATVSLTPPAVQDYAHTTVITFGTAPNDAAHSVNLMFHRNAFALAMVPLPMDLPGAEAFTATDPVSGLSVRARRFYDGNNSKLYMAVDVLYGVKTLDPNMAVRSET